MIYLLPGLEQRLSQYPTCSQTPFSFNSKEACFNLQPTWTWAIRSYIGIGGYIPINNIINLHYPWIENKTNLSFYYFLKSFDLACFRAQNPTSSHTSHQWALWGRGNPVKLQVISKADDSYADVQEFTVTIISEDMAQYQFTSAHHLA